jgi:hypothetical protein
MNPEGIGYQPMVATVQLQVSFIGGQGLEKPVERLQNALSSNFFANTEMYDERSETTATTINGKKADEFTKEFLEQLSKKPEFELINDLDNPSTKVSQGVTIGKKDGANLNYTELVNSIYDDINNYVNMFKGAYSDLVSKYGDIIAGLLFSSNYRPKNILDVYSVATAGNMNLLGLFDDAFRSLKASTQRSRREKNKEQVAINDIGMASFFIQQKKYQEGEAFLLNIMTGQNPSDEYYWNTRQLLSEIYVQTGRVSKAIPMHQEVLEFGRRGDNDVNMLVGSICLGKDYGLNRQQNYDRQLRTDKTTFELH